MTISIFTSFTNPEKRMDPYKEALACYSDFADEVIIVGQDWPEEFTFSYIGKVFQQGFNESKSDWVLGMDIDNILHEKDIYRLRNILSKYDDQPCIAFPKFQIFTPDRFNIKTLFCIAFNKKKFPNIKLNGGGDLCQPTLNDKLINPQDVPNAKIPIWNYDSVFKTKEVISHDRARFARAWEREFNSFGDRGGKTDQLAFEAWFKMIEERYKKHYLKLKIEDHPKYIKNALLNLNENQFGYDAFGLKYNTKFSIKEFITSYRNYLLLT